MQSLVKCLVDHRDIVSGTACSQAKVVLGCAMHLGGYIYSYVEMLKSKAAEKQSIDFCKLSFVNSVHQSSLCASSSSGTKPRFRKAVSGGVAAMYEMNSSSPAASGLGSLSHTELTNTKVLLSSVPV